MSASRTYGAGVGGLDHLAPADVQAHVVAALARDP